MTDDPPTARVLFLSDTHLGEGWVRQPRVVKERRGDDFFRMYHLALEPAFRGEVDLVLHGGDVFFRSKIGPDLVQLAFEPLRRLADMGLPIVIVPGNHERSRIPFPLLTLHPNIWIVKRPETRVYTLRGVRLAIGAFPFEPGDVASKFPRLLQATGVLDTDADVRVLAIHHAVEGAKVGPQNYTFYNTPDTIRCRDLPAAGLAAILSGHIHRHQILTHDCKGHPLPCPVLYPGSTERTSAAEAPETKGYLTLTLPLSRAPTVRSASWEFGRLPTLPYKPGHYP